MVKRRAPLPLPSGMTSAPSLCPKSGCRSGWRAYDPAERRQRFPRQAAADQHDQWFAAAQIAVRPRVKTRVSSALRPRVETIFELRDANIADVIALGTRAYRFHVNSRLRVRGPFLTSGEAGSAASWLHCKSQNVIELNYKCRGAIWVSGGRSGAISVVRSAAESAPRLV